MEMNLKNWIDIENFRKNFQGFKNAKPFPYTVIDNFFQRDIALSLEAEFPSYDDEKWHTYDNPIEVKRVCNNWNVFPPLTYKVFSLLNSVEFIAEISKLTQTKELYCDMGLNGGGWHIHPRGGKLNTHLDYSIHPKLGLERKFNIIIYLNSDWDPSWGGRLGLWEHDEENVAPGKLIEQVECLFNRAVIFDTTFNSWHGLPEPILAPEGQFRKSIAVYYLTVPATTASKRGKALFAPTDDQKNDHDILDLIEKRSKVESADTVYRKK